MFKEMPVRGFRLRNWEQEQVHDDDNLEVCI